MCDCYFDHCNSCGKGFDIHLGDFNTGRDEVVIWCKEHMPDVPGDGVLFEWDDDPDYDEKAGAVYIQALTPNAIFYAGGNSHNGGVKTEQGFGALDGNRVVGELEG